jgi:hypothetical protein
MGINATDVKDILDVQNILGDDTRPELVADLVNWKNNGAPARSPAPEPAPTKTAKPKADPKPSDDDPGF